MKLSVGVKPRDSVRDLLVYFTLLRNAILRIYSGSQQHEVHYII